MGIYLSSPKTEKFSEDGENGRVRYGLSSMQGWRATMEDAHAAYPDLDASTSFFGVYDGHGGKVVAKFCAKYLHQQVLKNEAYAAGDIGTSVQRAFFRMDEMMRGQRGWRELAILGDKMNKFTGMIEGLIWSPRSGDGNDQVDNWAFEEGPHSDFSGPKSGSTACVAVLRNNQLLVANAGDSRCVISRKGQAYNLSRDHKPDLEVEKERILKAGGFIHAGRVNGSLNLARAIGDVEFKQNKFLPAEKQIVTANPDINTVELCDDDDFIVLACDGIWDCMSSQMLVDFIHEQLKSESKLSVICERVLDRCLAPSTVTGEGCNGARPNRASTSGYWKATGTDKPIVSTSNGNQKVGVKKALVFYGGKPPKGIKTNWIMHEYRLINNNSTSSKPQLPDIPNRKASSRLDDWVLCRIYKKNDTQRPMERDKDYSMEGMLATLPTSSHQNPKLPNLKATSYYGSSLEQEENFFQGILTGEDMQNTSNINSRVTAISSSSKQDLSMALGAATNTTNSVPVKRAVPAPQYWNEPNSTGSLSSKRFQGDLNGSSTAGSIDNTNSFVSLLNYQLPQSATFHPATLFGSIGDRQQFTLPSMNWNS